jgi:hypothetical protein
LQKVLFKIGYLLGNDSYILVESANVLLKGFLIGLEETCLASEALKDFSILSLKVLSYSRVAMLEEDVIAWVLV